MINLIIIKTKTSLTGFNFKISKLGSNFFLNLFKYTMKKKQFLLLNKDEGLKALNTNIYYLRDYISENITKIFKN